MSKLHWTRVKVGGDPVELDISKVSKRNRDAWLDGEIKKLRSKLVWELREWPFCPAHDDKALQLVAHPVYFDAYGDPSGEIEMRWSCEGCDERTEIKS